jgi:hypothetical protein
MRPLLEDGGRRQERALATLPYGGMTRIRFEGYLSPASGISSQVTGVSEQRSALAYLTDL